MSLFIITFSPEDNERVLASLKNVIASDDDSFAINHNVIAVKAQNILTPQDLVEKLFPSYEDAPGGLVAFPLNAYWGYHKKELWSWLAARGV
ncbi:hypothetical protein [Aeromonas enteropelogenes]